MEGEQRGFPGVFCMQYPMAWLRSLPRLSLIPSTLFVLSGAGRAAADVDARTITQENAVADEEPLVWGARACFLEAGWQEPDCAALIWVAMKQGAIAKRSWVDVIRDY